MVSRFMNDLSPKDRLDLLQAQREVLDRRVLLSSGLTLLLAGVSRLPSWEVASPVAWLVGSVNVGFVPIFGPMLVIGMFCWTFLALCELLEVRDGILRDAEVPALTRTMALAAWPRKRLLGWGPRAAASIFKCWVLVVPIIAYATLLGSYFDFVRPTKEGCVETGKPDCLQPRYQGSGQVVDLLVGTGGWRGFRPLAPSITAALNRRAEAAGESDEEVERVRLLQIAELIPWIYPPFQTLAYIAGLVFLGSLCREAWNRDVGDSVIAPGDAVAAMPPPPLQQPQFPPTPTTVAAEAISIPAAPAEYDAARQKASQSKTPEGGPLAR